LPRCEDKTSVYDDDGLGAVPLGDAGDLFEVGDLEERVRRRFEQHHLELGCDIVYDSGTKYLSGHHDLMAGLICCDRDEDRFRSS
jgi:seryl-tRNA(Sec) selenium transferase